MTPEWPRRSRPSKSKTTRTKTRTTRTSWTATRTTTSPSAAARRRKPTSGQPLEGTFDHGEEGYGLWLDPAVQDDPVYAEHWAGHRPVTVTVEAERIVITRTGEEPEDVSSD